MLLGCLLRLRLRRWQGRHQLWLRLRQWHLLQLRRRCQTSGSLKSFAMTCDGDAEGGEVSVSKTSESWHVGHRATEILKVSIHFDLLKPVRHRIRVRRETV